MAKAANAAAMVAAASRGSTAVKLSALPQGTKGDTQKNKASKASEIPTSMKKVLEMYRCAAAASSFPWAWEREVSKPLPMPKSAKMSMAITPTMVIHSP